MNEDLVAFLRARLDEDESVARGAKIYGDGAGHDVQGPSGTWVLLPDAESFGSGHPGGMIGPRIGYTNHVVLGQHIARHDPARVLREVEAKRETSDALLAEDHAALAPGGSTQIYCPADYGTGEPCDCGRDERVGHYLRMLTLPYADHPDYRQEWRP